MKRDKDGRPEKPPMLGRAWPLEDLAALSDALSELAKERGAGYALELLDHGYQKTPLTAQQYDTIKRTILARSSKD
jgi:hypothetical protein